jgi:hypothetical protein
MGQARLTGKIAQADGKPLAFANVYLLKVSDTSLAKGSMANDRGEYAIEVVSNGHYFLQYSAVGFKTFSSPIFEVSSNQGDKHLDLQVMEKNVGEMDAVVVRASKPLFQQDMTKTVVNVQSSILSKGSSVLGVLERSPGVMIDRQNNRIVLNGKSSVLVMINDRVLRLSASEINNMLDGMSANNIEKIELLPVPPAKYDAEGSGGVINIVVKKDENYGTNGSVAFTAGYGLGLKSVAGFSLNHRKGPLNLYGSYNWSYDKSSWKLTARGGFQFPYDDGKGHRASDFVNERNSTRQVHNATAGIDYMIDKKTSIGASSILSFNTLPSKGITRATYTIYGDSLLVLGADMTEKNKWVTIINNVNLQRTLGKDEKINLAVDYIYYENNNPSSYVNFFRNKDGKDISSQDPAFFTQQKITNKTPINIWVYSADYEKRFSSHVRLMAGVKASESRPENNIDLVNMYNGEWQNAAGITNVMNMKESIKAAYSSVELEYKKIKFNVGLRYEHTNTQVAYKVAGKQGLDRRFGNLFPSVFVRRELSDNASLQFAYSRRIARPPFAAIAPSVTFNDIYSIYLGNPMLRPAITDNIQGTFQYKQYLFSLTYSKDKNQFIEHQHIESPSDSSFQIVTQNLKYQQSVILQSSFPLTITSWWKTYNSISLGWKEIVTAYTAAPNFTKEYPVINIWMGQYFTLPAGFAAELTAFFYSTDYSGAYKRRGFGSLGAGLKKDLKNNKGSFLLSAPDLFSLTHYRLFMEPGLAPYHLTSNIDGIPESRRSFVIKLTYTKSFGNNKVKSQRQVDSGSREERDRIRKD